MAVFLSDKVRGVTLLSSRLLGEILGEILQILLHSKYSLHFKDEKVEALRNEANCLKSQI